MESGREKAQTFFSMERAPSPRPSPPMGERVPEGRVRGIPPVMVPTNVQNLEVPLSMNCGCVRENAAFLRPESAAFSRTQAQFIVERSSMAPQPLEPSNRIAPWMNVAPLFLVDDLHRHELDRVPGRQKSQQDLGLDFKMGCLQIQSGEDIQSHKPKTA